MPTYRVYLKNLTDTSHADPAPGTIKEIVHTAEDPEQMLAALLYEIRRTCSEPYQHYTWTIQQIAD